MISKTTKVIVCLILIIGAHAMAQSAFTGKPMYQILTKRGGTFLGTFTVELFPNIAPKHVRNFDSLVSQNFYDTTAFHRCIPGFMIQGGDPNSRSGPVNTWGYGQPNQPTVPAEFSVAKHVRGILSAARKPNPLINSATSQFFICVAAAPSLNGQYSVYGRVTKGMNWVDTIVLTPKTAPPPSTYSNMPLQKIEMFVSYIGSNDTIPNAPTLNSPPDHSVAVDTAITLPLKWNAVSDAIIYHLDLSTDSLFITDTIASTDSPNLLLNQNNFKGNTWYYWRVRANNGGHFSPYSQTWRFHTVGETTGLPALTASENTLMVYPNPSNGKVNFDHLEKGSLFELFDPSGKQMVAMSCRETSMILSMEKKDKGVYCYKITDTKGKTRSGKFVIQ